MKNHSRVEVVVGAMCSLQCHFWMASSKRGELIASCNDIGLGD